MPQFIFQGPDGQQHTIEGPPGSTSQEAFQNLQRHLGWQQEPVQKPTPGLAKSAASGLIQGAGAPGDFSQSVLGSAPPQQPIDRDTYYGKLVDALNQARQYLELPTTQKVGNAVGMQPSEPVTGAEKAVQRTASMLPGAIMGGAGSPVASRAMMGAAPAANAVRNMGMSPQGPASSIARDPGGTAQQALLRSVAKEGLTMAGHAVGGPLGGIAARLAPKVLRWDQ